MQGEPLSGKDDAMRFMLNIADGLIYACSVIDGFVHGDLKPENVLISTGNVAKVTDLGLSRSIEEAVASATLSNALPSGISASVKLEGTPLLDFMIKHCRRPTNGTLRCPVSILPLA